MTLLRRALGAVSRRLDKPELVSAFYPLARRDEHEAIALKAVLASVLRRDSCYVDVGTNRGQVLKEAVRIASSGRHVAFEPIPVLALAIESEFPTVECRRLALGGQAGEAQFCHFRDLDGWSGFKRNPEISASIGRPEYISVTVSTLDQEVTDMAPSVVKIDVEGAELEVLRGGRSLLADQRPTVILEHVRSAAALYGASSAEVWELLTGLGYEIYSIAGEGPVAREAFGAGTDVVNWLARPLR